jgi:glycosyltransferase involved in cell wall biosynthesis
MGFDDHGESELVRTLNILHVASHDALMAGGAVQMARLASGLQERGHKVTCVFNLKSHRPGGDGFESLTRNGIEIHRFRMQHLRKYLEYLRFRHFVKSENFDIIHAHRVRALQFVLRSLTGLAAPPVVGDRKNSFPIVGRARRCFTSDKVCKIVVNAGLIRELLVGAGVPGEKVEIIYNGIELDRFHPDVAGNGVRRELGLEEEMPVIGVIANFARKKAHGVFFEAAREVAEKRPDVRFLMVGGGSFEKHEQQLSRWEIRDRFIFTGFRRDMPEVIASLTFSVISSTGGEGLTGSLVESMAMGKPVISTAVAGNPEVIVNGETGLLVRPGDAKELARAMLFYLDDPEKAEAIGRRGYVSVRDKVDNRLRVDRMETLYKGVLGERGVIAA